MHFIFNSGSGNDLETEDAAELDRWEQEQIRKGVGVTQVSIMVHDLFLLITTVCYEGCSNDI